MKTNLLNTAAARTKSPSDLNASSAYWKADICLYQLEGEEILEEVQSNANSIFQDLKDTLMEYVPIEEIEDSESNEEEELLSQFSANMEFLKENNFGKDEDTEV